MGDADASAGLQGERGHRDERVEVPVHGRGEEAGGVVVGEAGRLQAFAGVGVVEAGSGSGGGVRARTPPLVPEKPGEGPGDGQERGGGPVPGGRGAHLRRRVAAVPGRGLDAAHTERRRDARVGPLSVSGVRGWREGMRKSVKKEGVTEKKALEKKEITPGIRVVGEEVKLLPIETVKPNGWNPNRMSTFMRESLKRGLLADGWLLSQSLLVWGTDEKGSEKNLIIDGEHRWLVGKELGLIQAPMVLLHRMSEGQAKALTIKMNQKRGEFDDNDLGALIREIQNEIGAEVPMLSFNLGIETEELMRLMALPPVDMGDAGERELVVGSPPGEVGSGMDTHVRMVQLFFSKEQYDEFVGLVKLAAPGLGTKNVSDTSLEALRWVSHAGSASK